MKKKFFACTLATILLSGILCLPISALSSCYDLDGNLLIDASDLRMMADYLVKGADNLYDGDVDSDNTVSAFDFVKFKRDWIAEKNDAGEYFTNTYAASAEIMNLTGRTTTTDDAIWLVQSGAAAEFTITGTEATLTLAGDGTEQSDEKYRPRYAVYMDDVLVSDSLLWNAEDVIHLFSGIELRTVRVKVIHLSEANNGAVGIRSISVTSNRIKPVFPTADKPLQIEFIGDSITCGYGVEAESQYVSFSTGTENFMKSYAYLTAQKLNADYSAVCYSGYGIISGYTNDGTANTASLVPDYYDKVGASAAYAQNWDFAANPNDVVVLNLGTNDYSYLSTDLEGRSDEFRTGYLAFIAQIREKNPDAYIICTMGTMGGEEVYAIIADAVESYQADTGDERITSYYATVQKSANGYGADWHPSEITQEMSACVLADKICGVLGIESDRVGLDAAEGATYDVVMENGANCAFYVGYDYSFWINTVTGGSSASDILATLSGISLISGEYQLEFDYVSSVESELQVSVEQDAESFFTAAVSATTATQHFSDTFTMEKTADASQIIFALGGHDSYNLTLSNITLRKLS